MTNRFNTCDLVSRKQGATVTVVNVGGPETEPTLRKALAIELTTLFV
jgi:electron transfer flavoprotein alpha/beta subunit